MAVLGRPVCRRLAAVWARFGLFVWHPVKRRRRTRTGPSNAQPELALAAAPECQLSDPLAPEIAARLAVARRAKLAGPWTRQASPNRLPRPRSEFSWWRTMTISARCRKGATSGWPSSAYGDVGLPGLDGNEVARPRRRAGGQYGSSLSPVTDRLKTSRALEAGFDAHLTKPVTMDRLAAIIAPRWSARGRGHCQSLYASPIAWRKPVNAGSVFRTAKSRSVGTPIRSSLPFASTSTIRRRAATASAGRLSRARTQARL